MMTGMKEVVAHFYEALRSIDRESRSPNGAENLCFTSALGLLDLCDSGGALWALAKAPSPRALLLGKAMHHRQAKSGATHNLHSLTMHGEGGALGIYCIACKYRGVLGSEQLGVPRAT
jgi:hypothetical protein